MRMAPASGNFRPSEKTDRWHSGLSTSDRCRKRACMVLQCKLEIRVGAEDSNFVMNFTSMSGNSLGKAVHGLDTLPHRVNVRYVRHLAKEWASDAGKLASRNQSVHLVLESFAAPLGDLIVLWNRSVAGNVWRRLHHGKTMRGQPLV